MAARKKARRKKSARKASARRGAPLARLERALPPTLREYATQVRTRLNQLEKQIEKAQVQARRRAARLLSEASHQLGKLEAHGEPGWRKLAAPYRRELVKLVRRLEKAVAPPARRRPARKAAAAKRPTPRKAPSPREAAGEERVAPPPAARPPLQPRPATPEGAPPTPRGSTS